MNRILLLLVVSIWLLSNAVSSVQGAQQPIKPSSAIYSIVTRNRTPRINPGGKVEIEIFLSGHGVPDKNKLYIQWSSPYIIDKRDPGNAIFCLGSIDDKTGKASKALDPPWPIRKTGIIISLNKLVFKEMPSLVRVKDKEAIETGLRPVISEYAWNERTERFDPPILLTVNIAEDAPSGDYDISFTFTYGSEQNLSQDYKSVPFHITSWWERNQGWVTPIGVSIAFISLLIATIGIIYRVSHPE